MLAVCVDFEIGLASHYLEFNDAIIGMVNKKSIRLLQKIYH